MDNNHSVKIKLGIIYAPQEGRVKKDAIEAMYGSIKEQIEDAREKAMQVMVIGDFNCKVGNYVEGNHEEVTMSGKKLLAMLENENLQLMNASDRCDGLWTRQEGDTKSVIDYVLVGKEEEMIVQSMMIDEEKSIGFYRPAPERGKGKVIYSDHNTIRLMLNLQGCTEDEISKNDENWWRRKKMSVKELIEFNEKTDRNEELVEVWRSNQTTVAKYTEWNERVLKIRKECIIKQKKKDRKRVCL